MNPCHNFHHILSHARGMLGAYTFFGVAPAYDPDMTYFLTSFNYLGDMIKIFGYLPTEKKKCCLLFVHSRRPAV
jgi:hypothetical protein